MPKISHATNACQSQMTVEEQALRPLAETITAIEPIKVKLDRACLLSRFEIGQLICRNGNAIDQAKQLCIIHRLKFWKVFSERLGVHERTLRQCVAFALQFRCRGDVERLVKLGVTWTHVTHLITLQTNRESEDFLRRVSEEGLTAAALQKEIMEKYGNHRPGSGKKKPTPKPPSSMKAGLKLARDISSRIVAQHEHALFGDDFFLPMAIENEPPDEITPEVREQVVHLIRNYRELEDTLPDIVKRLEASLERIDHVFEERERAKQKPALVSAAS